MTQLFRISSRPAIQIVKTLGKHKSKLGGYPNLPRSVKWPVSPEGRQLDFLAQFHCPDLPKGFGLPEEGMLFFFYDFERMSFGDSYNERENEYWRVVYSPEKFTETTRRQRLQRDATISNECFVRFTTFMSQKDKWPDTNLPLHQMFGYPTWVQGGGLSRGESLLLQLDSDDGDRRSPGWMWGDVGLVYFTINNKDLAERNFANVKLELQCH